MGVPMHKGATTEVRCSIQYIPHSSGKGTKGEGVRFSAVDEGRKRVIGLMDANPERNAYAKSG